MSTPPSSQKSKESDDSNPQDSRPTKYYETLRLLFSEDPEDDETLQPFSSGISIDDVTEPKVAGDGDIAGSLLGEGEFRTTEKKIQVSVERLNPIPFVPAKVPLFARHEEVLRSLGLWDFAHMDFDRSIRVDLLAQLIRNYNASSLDSYVNGRCVEVSKAALGLALNLPERKRKRVKLEYSDDLLEFLEEFVFGWLLLHRDDDWVVPQEVKNWLENICRGRLEKADWAGLVWVMVEKELAQRERLRDCYYASHLQRLIKRQHEELFLEEEEAFKMDAGVEGINECGAKSGDVEVGGTTNECAVEGVQGECGDGKEDVEGVVMPMDIEHIVSSSSQVCDVKKGAMVEGGHDEYGNVIGEAVKDEIGEGCSVWMPSAVLVQEKCGDEKQDMEDAERATDIGNFKEYDDEASRLEDRKYVDEAMVEGEDNGEECKEGDGDDNLVETMERGDVALGLHRRFGNSSSRDGAIDKEHIVSSQPLLVEHDDGISAMLLQQVTMPVNFEQIHEMMERARTLHAEKELLLNQTNRDQQILLNKIQGQDAILEHPHKIKLDEIERKNVMIYRLQRELHLKKAVLDAYKKALKETQEEFDNYVQRAKLCKKSPCKDAGRGKLVLSPLDMAKIRKEEERCVGQFKEWIEKIKFLDKKLTGFAASAEKLKRVWHAK